LSKTTGSVNVGEYFFVAIFLSPGWGNELAVSTSERDDEVAGGEHTIARKMASEEHVIASSMILFILVFQSSYVAHVMQGLSLSHAIDVSFQPHCLGLRVSRRRGDGGCGRVLSVRAGPCTLLAGGAGHNTGEREGTAESFSEINSAHGSVVFSSQAMTSCNTLPATSVSLKGRPSWT
jgi:hypothetical protein